MVSVTSLGVTTTVNLIVLQTFVIITIVSGENSISPRTLMFVSQVCVLILMLMNGPKISWHVPNHAEIDLALQIFKDLVDPTLTLLNDLLADGSSLISFWATRVLTMRLITRCNTQCYMA